MLLVDIYRKKCINNNKQNIQFGSQRRGKIPLSEWRKVPLEDAALGPAGLLDCRAGRSQPSGPPVAVR